MEKSPLAELLMEDFDTMPERLRAAARFVLEHPAEVAWLSMREQGRRAGVSHSTMVRLAAWLGLDSYDDLRALCAQAQRNPDNLRLGSANSWRPAPAKEEFIIGGIADSLAAHVVSLGRGISPKRLLAAANALAGARQLFCYGVHSGEMIARHFAYLACQMGKKASMIGIAPENGTDATVGAGAGDTMLVVSFAPHSQVTSKLAFQMLERGVAIVAVTDGKASTLQRMARQSIVVPTKLHSSFPSVTATLAAAEILAALTAEKIEASAEEARLAVFQS